MKSILSSLGVSANAVAVDGAVRTTRRFQTAAKFLAILCATAAHTAMAQVRPPVTIECPRDLIVACTNPAGRVVNFTATAESTAGDIRSIACQPPSGSVFGAGVTTVQCVATDALGNTAMCSFTITVRDTQPPVLQVPAPIQVECAPPAGVPVVFNVTATDTCDTNVIAICTPPSGSVFSNGVTTVRCLARDGAGNLGTNSFTVTVGTNDLTPPFLAVPASVNAICEDASGAVVTFGVEAGDACSPSVTLVCGPPSGSKFPIGTTIVTCVATDRAGNTNGSTFPVQVSGQCGACIVMTCPTNIQVTLGSRGGAIVPILGPVGVTVDFTAIASNSCTGSNLVVDCSPPPGSLFGIGTHTVRCHTTDGVARDACEFQITIKDVTPPVITVPRGVFASCNEKRGDGTAGRIVNFTVGATDNAGLATLVCTPPSGSFFQIGQTVVQCVATDGSGNKATNKFTVTVTSSLICSLANTLEDMPDNWGFELGLTAWEAAGDAFEDQPVEGDRMPVKRVKALAQQITDDLGGDYWKELSYPVGHEGQHWIGTAENVNALPGGLFDGAETEERTGTLRSKSFIIEKNYISFLIGGGDDAMKLRVELLVETDTPGTDTVTYDGIHYKLSGVPATGHGKETMRWQQWGVIFNIGKRAIIRIIDNSTTGHLNVDDFRFYDNHFLGHEVTVGGKKYPAWIEHESHYYYWDSPVWGFADMHAHPMSYLGFGHFVMHGELDGNIESALENCRCRHGGWGLDNTCGDYLREIVMKVMEDGTPSSHGNGYVTDKPMAQFNGWPVFWTISHQQMWHEWVKRAHEGGLRVMVALCVNNPLLAVGTKGDKPNDDKSIGDAQIDGLKDFVARHSDFMEIAYDPFQLRDIVRRDKLAVIIGSELDDIGNFARSNSVSQWAPTDSDKQKVRAEIQRLYDKGMRYIFPVHLMNNHFGGTAVGDDMLNVANKFLNHQAFEVEPGLPGERINFYLSDLDFTEEAALIASAAPFAPLILPALLPFADAFLAGQGVPPGSAAAIGAGVLPLALMGTVLLPVVGVEIGEAGIPSEVLPLFGNYPNYYQSGEVAGWGNGHKNAKGLTPLGKFAVKEMMKLGMMIDIDHMSQKTLGSVLEVATNNPVGYPLNSGHNSSRALGHERGENSRTVEQIDWIHQLGGLWGIGYENGEAHSFSDNIPDPQYVQSSVANDCAGTSKTFAQHYLYGVETMRGRGVALGTDINGLIPGPGPRFGPQSGFALGDDPNHERRDQVLEQFDGVLYTPKYGRPITGPAFVGRAVDMGVNITYPRTELGYAYNIEQADLFAAIRIFYWRKTQVENGMSREDAIADLQAVVDAMSGNYPDRRRIFEYSYGLLTALKDWPIGYDLIYTDVESLQRIGNALVKAKVLGEAVPDNVKYSSALKPRYDRAVQVWNHYHRTFGENIPLKRCQTGWKQWDYNFEGVAHYGMIPDMLQDLSNLGMAADDMSVLFKSAEHFAQMWTKSLNAADAINHPAIYIPVRPTVSGRGFELKWFAEDGDQLEETDNLSDPASWRPSSAELRMENDHMRVTIEIDGSGKPRFFRVRKP